MENFEKCAVAMLRGQCSQHVTGNTSRQNQPQSAIIAYPRWRRQRYRHSRRMHTRKFTYLARGPLLLNDTAIIFLNRESPDSIYIVTEWRQSIIRMTRTDSNDISATGLRDYIYYIYIECCTYIIYKCLLFYSNWSLCFVGIRHLMKLKYTMPHVPDFLRSVWLEISTDFFWVFGHHLYMKHTKTWNWGIVLIHRPSVHMLYLICAFVFLQHETLSFVMNTQILKYRDVTNETLMIIISTLLWVIIWHLTQIVISDDCENVLNSHDYHKQIANMNH